MHNIYILHLFVIYENGIVRQKCLHVIIGLTFFQCKGQVSLLRGYLGKILVKLEAHRFYPELQLLQFRNFYPRDTFNLH